MSRWFIYALVDPRTKLVRYVGQTSSGMKRPRHHACPSQLRTKKTHRSSWIVSLKKLGLSYEIAVLETLPGPDGLHDAERWWISFGRACGWDLTNHTDGGEGLRGYVFSADHRARISAAHVGRRLPSEHREAISEGNKGRVISEFVRARTAEANRSRIWTDAAREKLSRSKSGRRQSDQERRRKSERQRGRKLGPRSAETRAKLSRALRGRPQKGRPRNPPRMRINLLAAATS